MAGLVCLVAALFLVPLARAFFLWGGFWFEFIPFSFILALIATGLFLIYKRRQIMSKRARILLVLFLCVTALSHLLLVTKIQYERGQLQTRARAFLLRPMPIALKTAPKGGIEYHQVGTNEDAGIQIFGNSRDLIKRYATNGRIRWSAHIQGEFATTLDYPNVMGGEDIERTNLEVHAYMAERNAILSDEWRMGFWQAVEDTIEMKLHIPEYDEEDFHPPLITNNITN